MNVDIDPVIRIFFSLKYELGLDGISARLCSSTLNQSPSVPYRYKINYGKCSKISNTLKLRTPKIIAENNF